MHSSPLTVKTEQPTSDPVTGRHRLGWAGCWAILSVSALLLQALIRLVPRAIEALNHPDTSTQDLILVSGFCLANAYLEGHRGFHLRFVPRVLTRTLYLKESGTPAQRVLAPLFAMGFFHARRRGLLVAWLGTLLIIAAVVLVGRLEQPLRGYIDAGVVVGLLYGLLSLLWGALSLLLRRGSEHIDRSVGDLP